MLRLVIALIAIGVHCIAWTPLACQAPSAASVVSLRAEKQIIRGTGQSQPVQVIVAPLHADDLDKLRLRVADGESTYELVAKGRPTLSRASNTVTWLIQARPLGALPAGDVTVYGQVELSGQPLEGPLVPVVIEGPRQASLTLKAPAASVRSGGVLPTLEVPVRTIDGQTPIHGGVFEAQIGKGAVVSAISQGGVVTFSNIPVPSVRAGTTIDVIVRGVAPMTGEASIPITLAAGEVSRVSIQRTVGGELHVEREFPLTVSAFDAAGNPVPDQEISLRLRAPLAVLSEGGKTWSTTLARTTNSRGNAQFAGTRVRSSVGRTSLIALAIAPDGKEHGDSVPVDVKAGALHSIRVAEHPPLLIVPEKEFTPAPAVLVEDAAGNPLVGVRLNVDLVEELTCRPATIGTLSGPTTSTSAVDGKAAFPGLSILGRAGCYQLRFASDAAPDVKPGQSRLMTYDAERTYNRNFVIISAIKSVAGIIPSNEFFDLRFRFRFTQRWHVLVNADVGLQRKDVEDKDVKGSQDRIVEAALWANRTYYRVTDNLTDAPERYAYYGSHIRVFATVPYFGFHAGAVELAKSPFHGSMANIGLSWAPQTMPVKVEQTSVRAAPLNLMLEAFIRSDGLDFFKFLNVKGTLMVPLGERGRRAISRISIGVPIGTITSF